MPNLQPWLQSSADPTQISNTVRGFVLSISSVIILVAAGIFHITLTADNVITLATDIGTVAGAVWLVYGLLMKGAVKVGSVR